MEPLVSSGKIGQSRTTAPDGEMLLKRGDHEEAGDVERES
jgi:hypothetical protein